MPSPEVMRCAAARQKAHAGAGLADHVLAVEREWQGEFLDSKGRLMPSSPNARTISSRTQVWPNVDSVVCFTAVMRN